MIRKLDRLYQRHPRLTFAGMVLLAVLTLYAADRADRDNRVLWAATQRGST
jgi:hypothetical protein